MSFTARIIAAYGRHLVVRDSQGNERAARPFGRKLQVVCGDQVSCELDAHHDEAHVTGVLTRDSCLYRTNLRAAEEPVVANLTLMLVTLAPLPAPDLFVIDRYLAAAASAGIRATLVLNKCELPWPPELAAELAAYNQVGYTHLPVSVKTDTGIVALRAACAGDIAVFVGQSGVGKSSLISRLVPEADIRTGELMLRTQEGTHTTTASRLYDLQGGGHLIDSPGVRDFAPALSRLEPTSLGFLEVAQRAPQCRFDDCRHLKEPACAVRAASESGDMSARRYESYRRLRRLFETLGSRR
ncbi:MAG TPA: ribosome small subunit-dependent GTPase A [Steroidobacteraceae bacterium]|jgi:ribosome biogenesis GTPase|nr:ribosome small subunit-dependent GTPase A [Steroidobacteraceae bacterium]